VAFIHADHLGSTAVTSGAQSGNIKYFPYGATRSGAVSTAYRFTGQRLDDSIKLQAGRRQYQSPQSSRGRPVWVAPYLMSRRNPDRGETVATAVGPGPVCVDPLGHCAASGNRWPGGWAL